MVEVIAVDIEAKFSIECATIIVPGANFFGRFCHGVC